MKLPYVPLVLGSLLATASLPAQVILFDNGGSGNSIETAANWDGDALPTAGETGEIGTGFTASAPSAVGQNLGDPLYDANFEVNGGTLNLNGSATSLYNNTVLTLTSGTISGRDLSLNGSSQYIQTGGDLVLSNQIFPRSVPTSFFDISGGTVSITNVLRGGGTFRGTVVASAGKFLEGADNINLGLGTGSLTLTSQVVGDWGAAFDFTSGTQFSLTVNGYDETAFINEYNEGDLLVDGLTPATFAEAFVVNGSTLTLVPEPSTYTLLALAGLVSVYFLRRRAMARS